MDLTELNTLTAIWMQATAGPARDTAFNNIVTWMANNRETAQQIARNPGLWAAAYQVYLQRAFAAQAAKRIAARLARPSLRLHMARLGGTAARAPKIPHPIGMGLIFIGAILLTGCSIQAETKERQAAIPSYNLYVTNYITKIAQAKVYHPQNTFVSPMTFDEWYEQNRR